MGQKSLCIENNELIKSEIIESLIEKLYFWR